MKKKLIALDWNWVTLIYWCQKNCDVHSSPAMPKVEGNPHKFLEKLKVTSRKSTFFGHFFLKFSQITFVNICNSLNTNYITPILYTCLTLFWYIFTLLLTIWWFHFGFGSCKWKIQNTIVSSWFHGRLYFSEKFNFHPLLWYLVICEK